jgi:putative phosphoesterase
VLLGLVSDTHGYLDDRLLAAFEGVDAILHAGDVGSEVVIAGLRRIALVHAVHGNNDVPLGKLGLPGHLDLTFDGVSIHLVHEIAHARPAAETKVVVFGHSHRQISEWRDGVLYVNPGAAGRQGFHRVQTAALLRIEGGRPAVEMLLLGPRLKLPRQSKVKPVI